MAFLAPALPFLAIAGTAIQGFSQFQQQQYQAQVAKNNAKIADENADRAGYAAQIEQYRSDREYDAQGATLLATQAASGFDVLGRSQIMSRANLDRVRSEQATDIRMQGMFNVRHLQQEQANFLGESRARKTQAWMGLAATAFEIGGMASKIPAVRKVANSLIGGT
jgi:Tfp pilus assembly protein PilV